MKRRYESTEEYARPVRAYVWRHILLAAVVAVANKPASAAAAAFLTPTPTDPIVGQTVSFAYDGVEGGPFFIAFGDGTVQAVSGISGTVPHVYSSIGFKDAELCNGDCMRRDIVATALVTVRAPAPAVPFGSVLGTSVVGGPFIAGGNAQIDFSYRVATQFSSLASTPQTDIQVIVDLEDTHGHLVRRSDPFVIESVESAGGFAVQTSIPYTIPADAKGAYRLQVYLRAGNGAAIAAGQPTPVFIFGGPDPTQNAQTAVHANGTIIAGPTTTTSRATSSTSTTSTQVQSDLTTALEWPDKTLALTGIYDPVSKRTDGILSLSSATPSPVAAPDAVGQDETSPSAPQGGQPQYDDVVGRTLTSLPQLLGSGEILRGLDLSYKYADGWAYHGAAGFTQLGTFATSSQRGDAFDIAHAWANNDTLRASFFSQSDDVAQFIPNGSAGPTASSDVVLEFTGPLASNLNALVSAGRSQSHLLTAAANSTSSADSADRVGLQYALGSVTLGTDYHNYGADFAAGDGPGAMSDVVGSSATASANLSPTASLSLAWLRDDKHSVFSHHTNDTATFSA
ncbi:MAG TPA: hypothetical protein VEV38_09725, partial [Candidatus Eremiobacteraceae bacterium]|nr:hypothetical protein [Candidatus Eremiobacteraceae bacterium]